MNFIKKLIIPSEQNNYSPVVTKTFSILIFAFLVLFFNLTITIDSGKVVAGLSINDVVEAHNNERQSRGLGILKIDEKLNQSAQAKAEAMLASDCWSHYCPDGKSPWEFFDENGYVYTYAGENLAHGFYDSETAMIAWMNSPTHRDNILKGVFEEVGVGIAYGTFQGRENNIIIAVHFGTQDEEVESAVESALPNSGNVQIISPQEGEYTNNNQTEITGIASESNRVEVYNFDEKLGEIPVNGGLFTYRPSKVFKEGVQEIGVNAYLNDVLVDSSDNRKFTVDTDAPFIVNNRITAGDTFVLNEKFVKLEVETNEKLSDGKIIINGVDYEFINVSENNWEASVHVDQINKSNSINLSITDLAGNEFSNNYDKASIINISDKLAQAEGLFVDRPSNPNNLLGLSDQNLKTQINLFFIIISIGVIAIDFLAARQTGMTGFDGKSHFHFANFIVLILIILIGGFNGQILEGLNL